MITSNILYDCDGVELEAGDILEPFELPSLEPEAEFLTTAPLWRVEPDGADGWRIQPQAGGQFHALTQLIAYCSRIWPNPVSDICAPPAAVSH